MSPRPSIIAVLTLLAVGLWGPSTASAAGGAGPFSAQPSAAAPQDKAGTFFRLHAKAGTARRQSVVVKNLSTKRKHLLVDVVDGRTGMTSGSVYTNREDPVKEAGGWIEIARKSVDIPPRSSMRIPFTLTVPGNARTGDHLAGIAVQDARRTRSKARLSVTQVVRVVVGVQIIVDGPREPAIAIEDVDLQALPGTKVPSVVVRLQNSGTKLCKPVLDVNVAGSAPSQSNVTRRLDTVLPGNTIDYPLPWPRALDSGTYDVAVQAKGCGDAQASRASVELGKPLAGTVDEPSPRAPTVIVKSSGVSWPTLVGLLVAVAAMGAASTALLLRRRRSS